MANAGQSPISYDQNEDEIDEVNDSNMIGFGIPSQSVLVVDDQPVIRNALAVRLKKRGIKVYRALNSQQALKCIRRYSIGVAVLDIRMPGEDGIQAAAQIKNHHPQTGIIFFTGFNDESTRARAAKAKVFVEQWVDKRPGSLEKAEICVVELLGRRRLQHINHIARRWAQQEGFNPDRMQSLVQQLEPALVNPPHLAPIEPVAEIPPDSTPWQQTTFSLEEVLYRIKSNFDEVCIGYADVALRDRAWRQMQQVVEEHLWASCEPLDEYRQQLADQFEAAVEKLESHQLLPVHLDAVRQSLALLSSDRVAESDVHECEKAWRRGQVDTMPALSEILNRWEDLYGVKDE